MERVFGVMPQASVAVVPECCGFQPRDSFFVGFARIDSFRCKQGAGP